MAVRLGTRTLATRAHGFEGLVRGPSQGKLARCDPLAFERVVLRLALSIRSSRLIDLSGSYWSRTSLRIFHSDTFPSTPSVRFSSAMKVPTLGSPEVRALF